MHPSIKIAGIYPPRPSSSEPEANLRDEYVVIVNLDDQAVALNGWSLTNRKTDGVDHFRYIFPRFLSNGDLWELEPGGLIFLHTGRGTNGATATAGEARQYHLFQHRQADVWADPGDTACLYDRKGRLVAAWELPGVRKTV